MAETVTQKEKRKIAIVGLMGLPASGKSTLSNSIKSLIMQYEQEIDKDEEKQNNMFVIIVRYDDFVPLEIQKTLICNNNDTKKVSITKIIRKRFLKCVYYIGSNVLTSNVTVTDLQFEDDDDLEIYNLRNSIILEKTKTSFLEKVNNILKDTKQQTFNKCFIIVDDNNYYRSMRNDIFLIAKILKCSFCVLYLKTPLSKCIERNLNRTQETRVTKQVIEEMNKKLEEPNPLENTCDVYCLQIPCCSDDNNNNSEMNATTKSIIINDHEVIQMSHSIINSIIMLLECSLRNPILYPDRTHTIIKDRKICTENEIHQADLVLRKWINNEISSFQNVSKINNPPKNYRRIKSQQLNTIKSIILYKLKAGEFKLVSSVHQDIEFRNEIISLTKDIQLSLISSTTENL